MTASHGASPDRRHAFGGPPQSGIGAGGPPLVGALRRPGPRLLELVTASCQAVSHDPVALARGFYEHLFALAPHVRGMFPTDMTHQTERLCRALLAAIAAASAADPARFEQQLAHMGAAHYLDYGVRTGDYPLVGRALVAAVRDVAGAAWSSQTCAAWVACYEWLAWHMVRGAINAGDQAEDLHRALRITAGDLPPHHSPHPPARPGRPAGHAPVGAPARQHAAALR